MRRNIGNLGSRVSVVITDHGSIESLGASSFACPLVAAWGMKPGAFRRCIGRFAGGSESLWRKDPVLRVGKQLRGLEGTPLVVHYLDVALELESIIRSQRHPCVVHCHGADFDWGLSNDNGENLRDAKAYRDACLGLAPYVMLIANSNYTRTQLVEAGFPSDRVVVNHFGIEVPAVLSEVSSRSPMKILYLGRLVDCKGPDLLIRAFALACSGGLDAELTIAGDGPMRDRCEALAREQDCYNRIHFLGTVSSDQGNRLRCEADVFTAHNCTGASSGRVETFGVSILEAMAHGLPVVTGESGGVVDMIESGVNGFLFEPGDISRHAELLCRLGGDLTERRRVGEAARNTVRAKFSVESETKTLERIVEIAERLAEAGSEAHDG
ncbi:GDP-mannose-dependent alpha-(1-6)-phosphatidylinositol monomannoside mannosyltransferase [Rosistilla oblonga]|nr:GDP-mannose-dependent alpha-(1-6)-phosphatidylinositol monomannoside mannosyltransferase [Rosistilla oblonga]